MTRSLDRKSTTSNATNCCLPSECVLSLSGNTLNSENKVVQKQRRERKCIIVSFISSTTIAFLLISQKWKTSELVPSASDLDYAGVKFVAGTGQDLVKVKFTNGPSCHRRYFHRDRFEIQNVSLYDSTELFLRNLMAFEQCCPGVSCYFISCAFLMDMLVNSEKDVEVLQKAGTIQNYLGADQEVSDLFNKLCKEVVIEKFFFAKT